MAKSRHVNDNSRSRYSQEAQTWYQQAAHISEAIPAALVVSPNGFPRPKLPQSTNAVARSN